MDKEFLERLLQEIEREEDPDRTRTAPTRQKPTFDGPTNMVEPKQKEFDGPTNMVEPKQKAKNDASSAKKPEPKKISNSPKRRPPLNSKQLSEQEKAFFGPEVSKIIEIIHSELLKTNLDFAYKIADYAYSIKQNTTSSTETGKKVRQKSTQEDPDRTRTSPPIKEGIEVAGEGTFRMAIIAGDFVVKVPTDANFNKSIKIIKLESEFFNKDHTGIYPKVYSYDPNGYWMIQERVKPVTADEFREAFKIFWKTLKEVRKSLGFDTNSLEFYKYFDTFLLSLDQYSYDKIYLVDGLSVLFNDKEINDFLKKEKVPYNKNGLEKINLKLKGITKKFFEHYFRDPDPVFQKIYRAFKTSKHKNDLRDVKPRNCGIASDGRFVILDAGFELDGNINEMTGAGSGGAEGAPVLYDNEGSTETSELGWYSSFSKKKKPKDIDPVHMKGKNKTMMQEKLKEAIISALKEKSFKQTLKESLEGEFKLSLFKDVTENFGIPRTQAVAEFCRAVQHLMEDKGVEVQHLGEGDLSGAAIDCLGDFPNYFQKHYGYEVEVDDMQNAGKYTLKDGTKIIVYLEDGEMGFEE